MATSTINIHAGDFATGKGSSFVSKAKGGTLLLEKSEYETKTFWTGDTGSVMSILSGHEKKRHEHVTTDQIGSLEVASEESVKRFGGTVGWGIAGALVLGPIGAMAGLLTGGRGKDVTFICKLKDGRKFLATVPSKTFMALQAATFH